MTDIAKTMQALVLQYNESEEGKQILDEVKSSFITRKESMDKLSKLMTKFVDGEEFKEFWGGRESLKESEFMEILENKLGKEVIQLLKDISASHLKSNHILVKYAQKAFNETLDLVGLPLLNDCIKEMHTEENTDFFSVFFKRLQGIATQLGEFAIDVCRRESNESVSTLESTTIH